MILAMAWPKQAEAESPELIPTPEQQEGIWLGEFQLKPVIPLSDSSVCPAQSACVLGSGGGFGGSVELRWFQRVGLLLGYEIWILDGEGVWELSTMQSLHVGVRYVFWDRSIWHPYVTAGPTFLLLGDTFGVESVGGGVDARLGVELELSALLALNVALRGRLFTLSPFTTEGDNVRRAQGFDLNALLAIEVGITVFESPSIP